MQPYYNNPTGHPGMMGGGIGMMNGMGGMGGMSGGIGPMGMGAGAMGGMAGPMNPIQQQQMMQQQQMAGGTMGQGGMGAMYGQAYKNLGYDYQLPELGYTPNTSWGAWDLASARYSGDRLDRGFFDNLVSSLSSFFGSKALSEEAAKRAHRRVYFSSEGADAGNRALGGAAAYNAFLIWDRDHHQLFHQYPSHENCSRLVGLAIAELATLWNTVQPRSSRSNYEEAGQYAAATAKYLYDRHYNHGGGTFNDMFRGNGMGMAGMPGNGMGGMNPMMGGPGMGGMMGPGGMMAPGGGMSAPGYGAMGMPGAMANGMGGMGGPMGGMNPMMGQMGQMGGMMNPMMSQMQGGINPMLMQGGYGNPNNEAQAMPVGVTGLIYGEADWQGMHPYHWGAMSGVANGSTPIDQMGNPTFPGGPGRSWYGYGYGQPRQF